MKRKDSPKTKQKEIKSSQTTLIIHPIKLQLVHRFIISKNILYTIDVTQNILYTHHNHHSKPPNSPSPKEKGKGSNKGAIPKAQLFLVV